MALTIIAATFGTVTLFVLGLCRAAARAGDITAPRTVPPVRDPVLRRAREALRPAHAG